MAKTFHNLTTNSKSAESDFQNNRVKDGFWQPPTDRQGNLPGTNIDRASGPKPAPKDGEFDAGLPSTPGLGR